MTGVAFRHVNLIAGNWRCLAEFYRDVFGCEILSPDRDLHGPELEAATGIADVRIRGAHLRLPGCGDDGPTLEVFEYEPPGQLANRGVNAPGFAHIAFEVADVALARQSVIDHGGSPVGDTVTLDVQDRGRITFAYMEDPEGNVIELQAWDAEFDRLPA